MKKYFTDAVSSLILSLKKQPPDTTLYQVAVLLYYVLSRSFFAVTLPSV